MAADGSIIIDSRIDQSGFNAGVKNMGKTLGGILNVVKTIGKSLAAAFIGGSIINSLRGIVSSFDIMKSSIADKFKPLADAIQTLKGAFINLLVTAIVPLIPFIVSAVQWFTNLLFTVTKLVGALFGVKQTMGGIATETKKATKEAKGALAAFDQINVLQIEKPEVEEGGGFITPEALTVSDDLLAKVQAIRDVIAEWFADPIGKLQETWGMIVDWFIENVLDPIVEAWNSTWIGRLLGKLWENFVNTWSAIFKNTSETIAAIKKNLLLALSGVIDFFVGVFTGDWKLAWEGIVKIVTGIFGALFEFIKGSLANWSILIGGWVNQFKILWAAIAPWFMGAVVNPLKSAFDSIQGKFAGMIDFIRNAFGSMANWLRETFSNAFNNIGDVARGAFNGLIDIINGLLNRIANSINTMAGIVNQFSWMLGGLQVPTVSAPNIPHLATGAVIPPNAAFAAVLGDQRSGRNIEAPESLIRQIVREETGKMQADISISFEGSLAQLVRELKPHIDRENIRIGRTIVK